MKSNRQHKTKRAMFWQDEKTWTGQKQRRYEQREVREHYRQIIQKELDEREEVEDDRDIH